MELVSPGALSKTDCTLKLRGVDVGMDNDKNPFEKGFNLVVLGPDDRTVVAARNFQGDTTVCDLMAEFVENVPGGAIVLMVGGSPLYPLFLTPPSLTDTLSLTHPLPDAPSPPLGVPFGVHFRHLGIHHSPRERDAQHWCGHQRCSRCS